MNTKTPMLECWKIHPIDDKDCLDCLSIKDCRSVRAIVSELLDALVGCVIQDCGCGDEPLENKYSHFTLSAYEDAFRVLEKHGKMEPYVFADGQTSGSLMRFVE